MTHDSTWDPTTVIIASVTPTRELSHNNRVSIDELLLLSDVYDEPTFMSRIVSAVNVHDARPRNASYIRVRESYNAIRHSSCYPFRVNTHNFYRLHLNNVFYTDTLFSKVKSLNGNVCAQVYTNGRNTHVFPITSKSSENIAQTLNEIVDDVGIPNTLICDLATEQVGPHAPMIKEIPQLRIKLHNSEKGRSTQNHRAETEIRELKCRWKARMIEKQVPARSLVGLWCRVFVRDSIHHRSIT
jgi:hypothetical protein